MTIIDKTTPRKTTLGNLATGDTFIVAPDTDGYIETFHDGIFFIAKEIELDSDGYILVVTNLTTGQVYHISDTYTTWRDENDDFLVPFPNELEVIPVKTTLTVENY